MEAKNRLLTKRDELEQLIKAKQDELVFLNEAADELSVYDQHPADLGSALFEREKSQGLLELWELELEKVDDALERCHQGQYGVCEKCSQPIEEQRLERLVNTTVCAECAKATALSPK